MQPGLPPAAPMDPQFPGMRHTFAPARPPHTLADEMVDRTQTEVGREPYARRYDAALRGLLEAGQPRPLQY